MAVLWIEGFDLFGDVSAVFQKYYGNTQGNLELTTGRTTGDALMIPRTSGTNRMTSQAFTAASPIFIGFGLQVLGTLTTCQIVKLNMMDYPHLIMGVVSNGAIEFFDGNGNLLLQSNPGLITVNAWNYIEIEVLVDYSNGMLNCRVNNSTLGSVSGKPLYGSSAIGYGSTVNNVSFEVNSCTSMDIVVDDIYALDTTGTTNKSFLGSVSVEGYLPVLANLSETEWAPVGNAVAVNTVNDRPADGDATYMGLALGYSSLPALFTFPSLTSPKGASVIAIGIDLLARKEGSGTNNIYPCVYYNNGYFADTGIPLTDSYFYSTVVYDTMPWMWDNSPWSPTEFNNCQFGFSTTQYN